MSNPVTRSSRKRRKGEIALIINAVESPVNPCRVCLRLRTDCLEMDGAVEVCSEYIPPRATSMRAA